MESTGVQPSADLGVAPELEIRGVYWTFIEGSIEHKHRPAVIVLDVTGDRALVVYGGKRPHPNSEHLEVLELSPEGKEMGLKMDTYFRHGSVRSVHISCIGKRMGAVPHSLFIEFEEIEYNYHLQARKRRK